MKRTNFRGLVAPTAAVLALGISVSACGAANEKAADSSSSSKLSGTLNGAGSSAQEAAQGAWQAGFQTTNPNVTVNYDPVGSGGGREQFLAGGVNFAGSDSYLKDEELAQSKSVCGGKTAIEVPDYVSPIAIVYNVDGVKDLQLSAKTAAKIFSGSITSWDDPAIKAENPSAKLPATKITYVHRSDDSGTTKNFTDWMSKAGEGAWTSDPDGLWPTKGGEGANGTSGVIDAVTNGKGTIGYADDSQAGDLSVAKIKVGSVYNAPSTDGAAKAVEGAKPVSGRESTDLALDIDRTTTEQGAYPLSLVSYLVGCPTYKDKATADLVKSYFSYVVSTAGQKAANTTAGSAPLPASLASKAAGVVGQIAAK